MHFSLVAMEVIAALEKGTGMNGVLAVQCALLHDTMEDCGTAYEQLAKRFGVAVAGGVKAVTKDEFVGAGLPKRERKKLQMADSLERIKKQPREIWIVKMADRIVNLQPPPGHWKPGKISRYREEALLIHQSLKTASHYLAARLQEKIAWYPQSLET
jgi:(p)ppGpp synthase/HD superfamily hydrolase